ncbi:MAG: tetratricopeptide repeat protein, partial [Planctomycetales bacterium]|nr:tetratricopeptide repeat protein [Planctomycetales bacterium]
APAEAPGYAAAHYWIAQRMLAGELTKEEEPTLSDPAARMKFAEQHLDRIEELDAASPAVTIMRAYVCAQTGRERYASELLEPLSDENFLAASMRLRLLTSTGDQVAAREQAKRVLELSESAQVSSHDLTADDHRSRVIAATLVGNDQALEAALRDWLQAEPKDPQAIQLLAQLCRKLVQQALAKNFFAWEPLVNRLCLAERLGSPREWVAIQLRDLVELREHSNACRDAWLGLLGSSDASEQLIELAGTTAAQHNEISQARKAFQRLTADGEAPPVVWNNLAWSLLQEPRPLPTEALAAVNHALEQSPENPRFRETRGQAHLMLKQWDQAIKDLEYALNGLPDSKSALKGLAVAYSAIGNAQLAGLHRELAGLRDPALDRFEP